jgi:LPXTG-motif cell wall-anchored protein
MINMSFYRLIFPIFFLFTAQTTNAQVNTTIKAMVDKNKILIGEPLQLTIEANLPAGSVTSFVHIDTIDHFELLNKQVIDTNNTDGGKMIKGIYKITSFDSGHWVIPSFILSQSVKTDTIPVDVVFSEFDPNQDYHDIKDIIEVAPPKKKQWWWLIAGGALLLAAIAIYLVRKKKPAALPVPDIMIDPFEEAMKQLELLQKDKPDAKKYHSKLTDIFRLYVFRKKGILSLQKTTTDLVLQLRGLHFSKEQSDKLSQALRLSDFVKFAKYVPTKDDDKNCFEEIRNSIMTIEKTESGPPAFGGR